MFQKSKTFFFSILFFIIFENYLYAQCPYLFNNPIILPSEGDNNVPINTKIRIELPQDKILNEEPEIILTETNTQQEIKGTIEKHGELLYYFIPENNLYPDTSYKAIFITSVGNFSTNFKTINIIDENPPNLSPKIKYSWIYLKSEEIKNECSLDDINNGFIVSLDFPEPVDETSKLSMMYIFYLIEGPNLGDIQYKELLKIPGTEIESNNGTQTANIFLNQIDGDGDICIEMKGVDLLDRINSTSSIICFGMVPDPLFNSLCSLNKENSFTGLWDFILIFSLLLLMSLYKKLFIFKRSCN